MKRSTYISNDHHGSIIGMFQESKLVGMNDWPSMVQARDRPKELSI